MDYIADDGTPDSHYDDKMTHMLFINSPEDLRVEKIQKEDPNAVFVPDTLPPESYSAEIKARVKKGHALHRVSEHAYQMLLDKEELFRAQKEEELRNK